MSRSESAGRTDPNEPASRARQLADVDLVGDWRLRSWVAEGDDGSVVQPLGTAPEGMLVYSAAGTMMTTIAPAGRPRLASADPLRGGSEDERRATAETFIAYAGGFQVHDGQVVHEVRMSLYPNWVGTRQVRHVRLSADGDTLELSTDPFTLGGRRAVQRLIWERLSR